MVLVAGLFAQAIPAQTGPPERRPALDKVVATMEAAISVGPEVRHRVFGLRAESSDTLSGLGPGVPYLSWQREGIGGGFEAMPNAIETLRLTTPFNLPWRISQNRDLREHSERVVDLGGRIAALETAGMVGREWIDLAAVTEEAQVAQIRLARLQKAVEIQRKKLELGEISGSEATQLEIQLAREAGILGRSLAERRALEERVLARTAGAFPRPAVGDLAALEAETAPGQLPPQGAGGELAENLWLQQARTRSELALVESKLTRSTAWGRPEADVEWERVPEIAGVEGYDAFGLRIGIPLHLGKAGKRKAAASEYRAEAAAADRERVRLELRSRLATAEALAKANELILESLAPTLEAMPRTELSLSEQFRLGAISYLVFLDGLARLDEVRYQAIEARRGLLRSRLDLAELTGDPSLFPSPGIDYRPPADAGAPPMEPAASPPVEVEP